MSKGVRPKWTTTVAPTAYDIAAQMEKTVRQSNKDEAQYVLMDIGKVWGLYLAWTDLVEKDVGK